MGVRRWLARERVVTALDGRVWRIRRRWKLRLRWRGMDMGFDPLDPLDAAVFLGDVESLGGFVAAIALGVLVIAAVAVVVTLLLPLVLLVLEAAVLVVWVVVLGRSWVVEAVTDGPPPAALRIDASGWRGSAKRVGEAAAALERGEPPR